jgi:glutamine cyclotransferase
MRKLLFVYLIFITACTGNRHSEKEGPVMITPEIKYAVTNSFPHDTASFTEGLVFHKGALYESTGSPAEFPETESVIGILNTSDGKIDEKVRLDKSTYFGEGIVFLNGKLFQLTYKNQLCFVYDSSTFAKKRQFKYQNIEGWGLTTDGKHIIMSDGTNYLTYIDSENFQTIKSVSVSENGYAVQNLNELEYIDGYIFANTWLKNEIVKINPSNGNVIGKLDLTNLKDSVLQINPNAQETNGIAYNPDTKKIFVTGKLWPKIYEIEIQR